MSFIRKTGHTTVETLAKRLHILFATTNYSRSDDPPHPIDGVQAQLAGPLTIQHRSLVTQRNELNQSCAAAKPASQRSPLGRGQSGPAYGPPLLDRLQTLLGIAFWQGQRSGTSKKLKKDSHY